MKILIFLMLFLTLNLHSQPYECSIANSSTVPNPGTNSVAVWPGGDYTSENFVNYLNNEFTDGWYDLYSVNLNNFPYPHTAAPLSDDTELSKWIIEGIRYMFYATNDITQSWNPAPKLEDAATCDATCVSSNIVFGQSPISWIHQCISGTSPLDDWTILLNEPPGTNWHYSLGAENILIAGGYLSKPEIIFFAFQIWVGDDGSAGGGHFTPIVNTCSSNSNLIIGLGVSQALNQGGVETTTVCWQRVMDLTGTQGTGTFWQEISTCSSPLPLELLSFKIIKYIDCNYKTIWTTASEINNIGFEIEHSTDTKYWENIGWVPGVENSFNNTYEFQISPLKGINYYRLKQIDFDGKFEYSNVESINNTCSMREIVFFPNPARKVLELSGLEDKYNYTFRIISSLGQTIKSGDLVSNKIDISQFLNGTYSLIINSKNQIKILKFVKI